MFTTLFRSKRTTSPSSRPLRRKLFRPALETLEDRRLLSGASSSTAALSAYSQLPLSFEANQGQTNADVRFLSRGNGYALFLTDNEAVLSLQPAGSRPAGRPHALTPPTRAELNQLAAENAVLRMQLVGANPHPQITGVHEMPGASNYFLGTDPAQWHTNVPTFGGVEYKDAYPGIDLIYYGNQRQLEYDFTVAPGADPERIRLAFQGAAATLDEHGNLILHTAGGEVIEEAPVLYQEFDGVRHAVSGRYVLGENNQIGFQVGAYDPGRPLVIDPVLRYFTYLGGAADEEGDSVAVDAAGNIYLLGETQSTNFPTSSNPFQAHNAGGTGGAGSVGGDVFIVKLNPSGSDMIFSTYLGGTSDDYGYVLDVDGAGNVYLGGETISNDFPLSTNPIQSTIVGYLDAFVTKLDASGSMLVYSTLLGGDGEDAVDGIKVDGSGNAYLTGFSASANFPTTAGAFQPNFAGGSWDAFVAKINPSGSALVYSTFLGGSNSTDIATSLAIDSGGNAYVTGVTDSPDFPTKTTLQPAFGGGSCDAFVAKLNPSGSDLVYSTFLGGSGDENALFFRFYTATFGGLAVDSSGAVYVTGFTASTDFPTTPNPLQPHNGGGRDVFVTKLNPAGDALVYSTYLGGSSDDMGFSNNIALEPSGNAYVTGQTSSIDFPTIQAVQAASGGGTDAFVTEINAGGTALVYSSYLGGSGDDFGNGIAVDSSGSAYVVGKTTSTDLLTASPLQRTNAGNADAFLAKIVTPGTLQFSAAAYTVTETGGSAVITVTRTNGRGGIVSVQYATSDGTGVAGADYVAASGTLTFNDGETSKSFTVPILDDGGGEEDTTVNLTLSDVAGATLGSRSTAALTIQETAFGQLQFSASAFSVNEAAGAATITVTRTAGSDSTATVQYATSDGTGRAGTDYAATSGMLTFAAGVTSRTFTVPIIDRGLGQGTAAVNLSLSSPSKASLGSPVAAVLTINDNDALPPSQLHFSVASYHIVRTAGATVLTVERTGSTSQTVTVRYATVDGTARAGIDYNATSGTLTLNPGELSQTFSVPILDDGQAVGDESFSVTLSGPTAGATLDNPFQATVTINDPPPANAMPGNLSAAASIFTHSDEAYSYFIRQAYKLYLHRVPEPSGLAAWLNEMKHGLSDERVEAAFLGSPEYIANHGGKGGGWLRAMYEDLLGREPDQAGYDYWLKKLSEGVSETVIAFGFAASREREILRIASDYRIYLGRTLDPAGRDAWLDRFLHGAQNEDVVAGFVGSVEYYRSPNKGESNRQAWIVSAFQDVLHRTPVQTEIDSWSQFLK